MNTSLPYAGGLLALMLSAAASAAAGQATSLADPANAYAAVPPTNYASTLAAPASLPASGKVSPADHWKAANATVAASEPMAMTMATTTDTPADTPAHPDAHAGHAMPPMPPSMPPSIPPNPHAGHAMPPAPPVSPVPPVPPIVPTTAHAGHGPGHATSPPRQILKEMQ